MTDTVFWHLVQDGDRFFYLRWEVFSTRDSTLGLTGWTSYQFFIRFYLILGLVLALQEVESQILLMLHLRRLYRAVPLVKFSLIFKGGLISLTYDHSMRLLAQTNPSAILWSNLSLNSSVLLFLKHQYTFSLLFMQFSNCAYFCNSNTFLFFPSLQLLFTGLQVKSCWLRGNSSMFTPRTVDK